MKQGRSTAVLIANIILPFSLFLPLTLNTLALLTPNIKNTLYPEVATSKFDIKHDLLLASWPDYVEAESAGFYDSILLLFRLIKENKIKKLLLDSGTPDGGILTEEVIAFVEQEVCLDCPLQKVALLESSDYHWDNNMVQFINYLILSRGLEVQFQMFLTREAAIKWLTE
jgi:hypothetical protein